MPKKKDIMQFQRVRRYKAGVAAINAAANAAGVATALVAHGKKLDLDMVAYGRLSENNQEAICAAVLAGKSDKNYASRDAVAAIFDDALLERMAAEFALRLINAALSAERIAELIERYEDAWELDLSGYNRLSAENKLVVCGGMLGDQPHTDIDVAKQAFEDAVEDALEEQALEAVNDVTNDTPEELAEMEGVLEAYWDIFEITESDMDDYRGLDPVTGKPAVHSALFSEIEFSGVGEVGTAFGTAVGIQITAEGTAVTAINEAATESDMGTALGTHKAILGIAESINSGDYHDLSDKTVVHEALIALRDFESIAEIRGAFNGAVAEAKEAEDSIAT